MRPTGEQGAIAVLDQPKELEVFVGYLDSYSYQGQQPGYSELMQNGTLPGREIDAVNPIGGRFHYQVDELGRTEFSIYENERDVAIAAAQRVLRSKNPIKRVLDQANGRTQAARDMLDVLDPTQSTSGQERKRRFWREVAGGPFDLWDRL